MSVNESLTFLSFEELHESYLWSGFLWTDEMFILQHAYSSNYLNCGKKRKKKKKDCTTTRCHPWDGYFLIEGFISNNPIIIDP